MIERAKALETAEELSIPRAKSPRVPSPSRERIRKVALRPELLQACTDLNGGRISLHR